MIGSGYSVILGNPFTLYTAKRECQQYVNLMYQGEYTVEEVTYDFLNRFFVIRIKDTKNEEYITFRYFKNPVDCKYKLVFNEKQYCFDYKTKMLNKFDSKEEIENKIEQEY